MLYPRPSHFVSVFDVRELHMPQSQVLLTLRWPYLDPGRSAGSSSARALLVLTRVGNCNVRSLRVLQPGYRTRQGHSTGWDSWFMYPVGSRLHRWNNRLITVNLDFIQKTAKSFNCQEQLWNWLGHVSRGITPSWNVFKDFVESPIHTDSY